MDTAYLRKLKKTPRKQAQTFPSPAARISKDFAAFDCALSPLDTNSLTVPFQSPARRHSEEVQASVLSSACGTSNRVATSRTEKENTTSTAPKQSSELTVHLLNTAPKKAANKRKALGALSKNQLNQHYNTHADALKKSDQKWTQMTPQLSHPSTPCNFTVASPFASPFDTNSNSEDIVHKIIHGNLAKKSRHTPTPIIFKELQSPAVEISPAFDGKVLSTSTKYLLPPSKALQFEEATPKRSSLSVPAPFSMHQSLYSLDDDLQEQHLAAALFNDSVNKAPR